MDCRAAMSAGGQGSWDWQARGRAPALSGAQPALLCVEVTPRSPCSCPRLTDSCPVAALTSHHKPSGFTQHKLISHPGGRTRGLSDMSLTGVTSGVGRAVFLRGVHFLGRLQALVHGPSLHPQSQGHQAKDILVTLPALWSPPGVPSSSFKESWDDMDPNHLPMSS